MKGGVHSNWILLKTSLLNCEIMNRILSVHEHEMGPEPIYSSGSSFIRSLNWYASEKSPKESKEFTLDYCRSQHYSNNIITHLNKLSEQSFHNLGFVCRMRERGFNLSFSQIEWIDDSIVKLSNLEIQKDDEPDVKVEKVNPSELLLEEVDYQIDKFIKEGKNGFNFFEYFVTKAAKGIHLKVVIDYVNKIIDEYKQVQSSNDEEIQEGYSNFDKKKMKSFLKFLQEIVDNANSIILNKRLSNPRKKKTITVTKQVENVQYLKESTEYKVKSIPPEEIIGATTLWVFNTKYKKLGVYYSTDESGFNIKGTTILNYDEKKSVQRIIKKPEEVLKEVVSCRKSNLKNVFKGTKTNETELSGRLNDQTLILRVLK